MITQQELQLILKEGEGYKIEFKENVNGLDREIVAFANASGGRIFLGVTDSGEPKGIVISNRLKSQVQDIANNCRPKDFVLGETIFRRNQIIADLFSRIHFGEKIGSGMKRIREYCKAENAPFPNIHFTETHFYVVFKPSREYIKISEVTQTDVARGVEKGVEKLSVNEEIIYDLIKSNPHISKKAMMSQAHLTKKFVEYNIEKLKKRGIIHHFGPDKGGHWEVVKK